MEYSASHWEADVNAGIANGFAVGGGDVNSESGCRWIGRFGILLAVGRSILRRFFLGSGLILLRFLKDCRHGRAWLTAAHCRVVQEQCQHSETERRGNISGPLDRIAYRFTSTPFERLAQQFCVSELLVIERLRSAVRSEREPFWRCIFATHDAASSDAQGMIARRNISTAFSFRRKHGVFDRRHPRGTRA